MKISFSKTPIPSFKAHSYGIRHKSDVVTIKTDNKPHLGNEPYLVSDDMRIKMKRDKNFYSAEIVCFLPDLYYYIEYKDTKARDLKDGKPYYLNVDNLKQDVSEKVRIQYKQPLIQAFHQGETVGRLFFDENFGHKNYDKISEPTIIVTNRTIILSLNNKNIVGFILTNYDPSILGHSATNLRHETDVSAAVLDRKSIEKLKSFNGKNVEIKISKNYLDIKETDKPAKPKTFPKIEVPEMDYCDELLTSDKYSPNLVGAKAVNLRKLEKLVADKKIDVIIPRSIALPYGYIDKYLPDDYYLENEEKNRHKMEDLLQSLNENGINSKRIMIRSAFNGEDLPDYAAAGLYRSIPIDLDPEYLYDAIKLCEYSKYNTVAVASRQRHCIPDAKIKPSVIIQNCIEPDYKFTLYTEFEKDNLKINLYSKNYNGQDDIIQPHVFNYDKKNKKLTYDSVQLEFPVVTYDENMNIVDFPPLKNDLSHDEKLLKIIQKLVDNALIIEKEFSAPQDIEGGLLGDDIYLWQTRNVVFPQK